MLSWRPAIRDGGQPVYLLLAEALANDVERGSLAPGTRLPTHRALAGELGINVGTVTRAYAEAARRGLIQGEVGRGTFVRARRSALPVAFATAASAGGPVKTGAPAGGPRIELAFNIPVEDAATPSVAAVLHDIAREADHAALFQGYPLPGLDEHRRAGAEWIARSGLEADPARTLVSGGAQHAMAVALASLVSAGDVVLAETVSYAGIRALSSAFGLRLEPVAIDAGGLVPEALEAACKRFAPKVLYCMPTLQNPTGTVLSEERRAAIAAIARRHGLVILEDDTYGPLCPDAPAPLASHAPERTYFVSSTSKTLAAGLRVGYLHAPLVETGPSRTAILERLVASMTGLGWMSAPLTAEIAARWIRQGVADRILARKREEIRLRRAIFERHLGWLETASHPASCHTWLSLPDPWRSEELVAEAARRGVGISSTELFVIGRASTPHAVRLCLGTPPSREELEQGLASVAEILAGPPGARPSIV